MFLLSFKSLITPSLIRLVFYVVVGLSVVAALILLSRALSVMDYLPGPLGLLAVIGSILGPLLFIVLARVAAELTMVVFMIRDELAWQREQRSISSAAE